jgi:hypothetical protein
MNAEQFKIPKETCNLHVKVFFHHHEAVETSQDHENCQSVVLAKIRGSSSKTAACTLSVISPNFFYS